MKFVLDLHCHPSLKTNLFGKSLTEGKDTSKEFNAFDVLVDIPKMQKGNVHAVIASHYLPEFGLVHYSSNLKMLFDIFHFLRISTTEKIEQNDKPERPFEQTKEIMDEFELKVNEAIQAGYQTGIAKSFTELMSMLQQNKTVFVHSLEGLHMLGRKLFNEQKYLEHLQYYFQRGVSLITLAHFIENDIVAPTEGVPPKVKALMGFNPPRNSRSGLSLIGETVVNKMLELGIVIDLTHSTPEARTRIFELNDQWSKTHGKKRPLVFSHVGVRGLFNDDDHPTFNLLCPSDEEIIKIKDCNGVIGIIFYNYWLSGKEEGDIGPIDILPDKGIDLIVETITYIHLKTGSYNHIALGTDFDGFTDPPDDLHDMSMMPLLAQRLSSEGIVQDDIDKIMGTNILRVLRDGWGKQ